MNKQEIISNIAAEHGVTKVTAKKIFEQIFEDITVSVMSKKSDNKFQVPGFGSFKMDKRAARVGRNPRTGETMNIKAKKVIKFKASKTLTDKLN